jgi:hypothetical protein
VAEFVNEHFIATYLKVGTFQIVDGQKQGGNVASYFCLFEGSVVHAVAGPVDARAFLREARWALETRKAALTFATKLVTGEIDHGKYLSQFRKAHEERFLVENRASIAQLRRELAKHAGGQAPLPELLRNSSRAAQIHWLLATNPLPAIEDVYPIVWERVLNERLSGLPVAQR